MNECVEQLGTTKGSCDVGLPVATPRPFGLPLKFLPLVSGGADGAHAQWQPAWLVFRTGPVLVLNVCWVEGGGRLGSVGSEKGLPERGGVPVLKELPFGQGGSVYTAGSLS